MIRTRILLSMAMVLITLSVYGDDVVVTDTQVLTGTISGNVIVENGGTAILAAQVLGNVTVEPGGALDMSGTVNGNVEVEGARFVAIGSATINGNLEIEDSGEEQGIGIFSSIVLGNVELNGNDSLSLFLGFPGTTLGNLILGNVEISDNSVQLGIVVAGNEVLGNLECSGNDLAPILVDNSVSGNIECDD